ncbi:class I SAM-dependent methyltransferase [Streptomyces sp. KMM 9044]|uniref:class I SAM-dependent methyltransferase n=1 Tax=Streptomyces sp. KMM 9044 TaxID=2744474 RepID=UPI0021519E94|nr:methyltransferase domain-containing protein [Streptomyces sp. KMM 9044]WAX81971.1 methyltransferase domain-containing protein [Streptomyces sp. KMM 9044]
MESYGDVLLSSARDNERARLGGLTRALDPVSFQTLHDLGVEPGWRCLDVGAGTGTVNSWLSRTVHGPVTALDRDSTFLTRKRSHLDVVHADVNDTGFPPGEFDLVHARLLVRHLRQREELLPRMLSWVRPGGLLDLTDGVALHPEQYHHPAYRKVMTGHFLMMANVIGSDLHFASRYPRILTDLGLAKVGLLAHHPIIGMNPGFGTFVAHTREQCEIHLLADEVPMATLDEAIAHVRRPSTREMFIAMLTAWGRRPHEAAR